MTQTSDDAEREIMRGKNADRYFEYLTLKARNCEQFELTDVLDYSILQECGIRDCDAMI